MRRELADFLRCPDCGGALTGRFDAVDGDHVMTGALDCAACGVSRPITRGVPRMNAELAGLEQVAQAFDVQWKEHHSGKLEDDTVYGWTEDQDWDFFRRGLAVEDADVAGAIIVDAGCGHARFTRQVAAHGAAMAIGVDVAEAVDEAFAATRELANVHIVQANVAAPPFAPGSVDLVWCRGVLHHTPDPVAGQRALAGTLKPGGTMFVWVYPDRFNPFRFVKDIFDFLRITRLPPERLLQVCRVMAYPSLAVLNLYRLARRLPGLRSDTQRVRQTVRKRGLREIQLTWFDALAPDHNSRHTDAEVIGWFQRSGLVDVSALDEPKVGVRGRAPA